MKRWVRLLILILGCQGLLLTAAHAAKAPISIGVALRYTPELNSFANSLLQGIEFAKENFQAKVPNLTFELKPYPHKSGHDSVESAARKIVEDKVQYVIGGEMSDEAFSLAGIFRDHPILLMTPTASNPLLTAGNPLVFRACFSDDQVAKRMAEYVSKNAAKKKIGVLHHTSNAYSDYLTNAFLDRLENVTVEEFRYAGNHPDFHSAVNRFKKAGVEWIVAFTLQEPLKAFHQLATQEGLRVTYVGSDGWGTNETLLKSVKGFKGIRNFYWMESSKTGAVGTFRQGFKKKYGVHPNAWNAIGYDSAWVLFQAIGKSKNRQNPTEVAEVLRTTSFPGVVTAESIQFKGRNTPRKPLYLYEVSESGVRFLKEMRE